LNTFRGTLSFKTSNITGTTFLEKFCRHHCKKQIKKKKESPKHIAIPFLSRSQCRPKGNFRAKLENQNTQCIYYSK
jgi:hypothetical protein